MLNDSQTTAQPCGRALCGISEACRRLDCPIFMVASGEVSGRWRWMSREQANASARSQIERTMNRWREEGREMPRSL